jgi:hypothetical protein
VSALVPVLVPVPSPVDVSVPSVAAALSMSAKDWVLVALAAVEVAVEVREGVTNRCSIS